MAGTDRITVKELPGTPPAPALDKDPEGVRRWTVTVPPGGKADIELGFQVTAPQDAGMHYLMAL